MHLVSWEGSMYATDSHTSEIWLPTRIRTLKTRTDTFTILSVSISVRKKKISFDFSYNRF